MKERERRVPSVRSAGAPGIHQRGQGPAPQLLSNVLRLQRLQRLAGNSAVGSILTQSRSSAAPAGGPLVVQRTGPTRAENIAALRAELAAAAADATKWEAVALRLNGFARADLPAISAEIPDAQLQAARSAVERHLGGWPAQSAILAAIDRRARKKNVSVRPLGSSIWAAYSQVGYNVWTGEPMKNKVWEHIGGSVGKKYAGGNTCAARVSWAFNNAGFPVSGGGEPNKAGVSYKGKKGDGQNYIVWVPSLQNYLTRVWGTPDIVLASNADASTFEATLAPGEVAVFAGPHHSGLIMQGYSDAYVKSDPSVMPVSAWKLPM